MILRNAMKVITEVRVEIVDTADNDYETIKLDYLKGDAVSHCKALAMINKKASRQVDSISYNKAFGGMMIRLK